MKVSLVTTAHNSAGTIGCTLESVRSQSYTNYEHIIIDNMSSDGTQDIVEQYAGSIKLYIREPDNGMYFGINKGIKEAAGDIVGILNSDDIYVDNNVLGDIVNAFRISDVDCVYGDLVYVSKQNVNEIIRYWRAGEGDRARLSQGWMPPHPAFFVRRNVYQKYGYFNTAFKISADYEIMLRFLYMHRLSAYYMHRLCVKMLTGGMSNRNLISLFTKTYEDYRICKMYGIRKASLAVLAKNLRKIPQFIVRA